MTRLRTALIAFGLLAAASTAIVLVLDANGLIVRTFAAVPLPDSEIQSRLQAQGFSNIQNLQHDGSRVIVTATKGGLTGQLAVDPSSGKVIRDSDGDDNDNDD